MKVIKTNIKAETVEINPREAGVPFRTLLVTGVPHETWTTVDTGKVRSAGEMSYREIALAIKDSHAHLNNSGTVGTGRSCVP